MLATLHSALAALFLASVIPTSKAWEKVTRATRQVLGEGQGLLNQRRNRRNITTGRVRIRSTNSYSKGTTDATFTIYAPDWTTELGTLENVHLDFGAYDANARAAAEMMQGVWTGYTRECEVSPL